MVYALCAIVAAVVLIVAGLICLAARLGKSIEHGDDYR